MDPADKRILNHFHLLCNLRFLSPHVYLFKALEANDERKADQLLENKYLDLCVTYHVDMVPCVY